MEENELKIMALRERIGELTVEYEDKVADLRVALTQMQSELERANDGLSQAREQAYSQKSPGPAPKVVEGEVVEPVQED